MSPRRFSANLRRTRTCVRAVSLFCQPAGSIRRNGLIDDGSRRIRIVKNGLDLKHLDFRAKGRRLIAVAQARGIFRRSDQVEPGFVSRRLQFGQFPRLETVVIAEIAFHDHLPA
jgi:hypothetical protein